MANLSPEDGPGAAGPIDAATGGGLVGAPYPAGSPASGSGHGIGGAIRSAAQR